MLNIQQKFSAYPTVVIKQEPNVVYNLVTSCDEDGFFEAWAAGCVCQYPYTLGRLTDVAGYGVWFGSGSSGNFGGVLNSNRPQNLKASTIYASTQALKTMKEAGYTRVRINLETEFLNLNVLGWIMKYMEHPHAEPANWDEYKYHPEILELCAAASGMIIKWSHCGAESPSKIGVLKAKGMAKEAADAWMKKASAFCKMKQVVKEYACPLG